MENSTNAFRVSQRDVIDDATPMMLFGEHAFVLVGFEAREGIHHFRFRATTPGWEGVEITVPISSNTVALGGADYAELAEAMGAGDGDTEFDPPEQLSRLEFEAYAYERHGVQKLARIRRSKDGAGNVLPFLVPSMYRVDARLHASEPIAAGQHDRCLPQGIGAQADAAEASWRAAPNQGARLRRVDLGDLGTASIVPPAFVIGTIVPRGHVTLLGGHGGIGKSTLALSAAAHFACGVDWLGFPVRQGRAVFVSLEDPGEIIRHRLRAITEQFALDPAVVSNRLVVLDSDAWDSALAVEEHAGRASTIAPTAALTELVEAAAGADFIVIDNASDAYDADENNRRMVRRFVRQMLGGLARANDAGLLLLAHIDKQAAKTGSAGNSYSGSTAWHNSARSRLALLEADGAIELRHEKSNLGPRAETLRLRFTDQGVLVPTLGGSLFNGDDDVLLSCMATAIGRGDSISTARTGPAAAHSHVRSLPGFPTAFATSRAFWQAIGRLEGAGRLAREVHTTPNRKQGERWSIPTAAPIAPIAPIP